MFENSLLLVGLSNGRLRCILIFLSFPRFMDLARVNGAGAQAQKYQREKQVKDLRTRDGQGYVFV